MTSSRILRLVGCISVACAGAAVGSGCRRADHGGRDPSPGATASAGPRPNVLLITLDTTRADYIGCYGAAHVQTPSLDGLAAGGTRFDDAVSVVPATLPAHATLLTGLLPPNHGVRNNAEFYLAEKHTTLAEVLREKGYKTAAFIAAFVLDGRFGLAQGFDVYDDQVAGGAGGFSSELERSAEAVTDAATLWLASAKAADQPFFLWVHYYDPHVPYEAHPVPSTASTARAADDSQLTAYAGEIMYMDSCVGRLLGSLDQQGLRNKTLIIAVGDHGESLGEHGEATHTRLIYEGAMRVPLIFSHPSLFRPGTVVDDSVVSIADVFPTVLDAVGVDPAGRCDGVSLLAAGRPADRAVYMETVVTYLDNGWAPLFALREHGRKFILAPRPEYYDLASDPKEARNLYGTPLATETAARLEAALDAQLAQWPSIDDVAGVASSPDRETIEKLEALGYVSGDSPDGSTGLLDPKDMIQDWEKIRTARNLSDQGEHQQAVTLLKEVLAKRPRDRTALRQIGMTYLFMGNKPEGEAALKEAIRIKPAADVCLLLAQAVLTDGRFDEAERLLVQATDLEPRHGGVWIARGDLLASRGRFEEARKAFEQAREVDPHRATWMAEDRLKRLRAFTSRTSQPSS